MSFNFNFEPGAVYSTEQLKALQEKGVDISKYNPPENSEKQIFHDDSSSNEYYPSDEINISKTNEKEIDLKTFYEKYEKEKEMRENGADWSESTGKPARKKKPQINHHSPFEGNGGSERTESGHSSAGSSRSASGHGGNSSSGSRGGGYGGGDSGGPDDSSNNAGGSGGRAGGRMR